MKIKLIGICLIISFYSTVYADMFGGSEMKIIVELKSMYKKMIETLEQAKTQNENLNNLKSSINEIVETRNVIQNFDLDRIVKRMENDLEGITQMDNLDGMNEQQRIRAVQRMLNKRIKDPDVDSEVKLRYEREVTFLNEIHNRNEILALTNENAVENLEKASTDISTRESSRITAESMAALVEIESQRQIQMNSDRSAQVRDQQVLRNINKQNIKMLKNVEESGW